MLQANKYTDTHNFMFWHKAKREGDIFHPTKRFCPFSFHEILAESMIWSQEEKLEIESRQPAAIRFSAYTVQYIIQCLSSEVS